MVYLLKIRYNFRLYGRERPLRFTVDAQDKSLVLDPTGIERSSSVKLAACLVKQPALGVKIALDDQEEFAIPLESIRELDELGKASVVASSCCFNTTR